MVFGQKYSKWYSSGKKVNGFHLENMVNGIHLEKKGKWSLSRNIVNGIHMEKKVNCLCLEIQ